LRSAAFLIKFLAVMVLVWHVALIAIDGHVMARLNEGKIFLPVGL